MRKVSGIRQGEQMLKTLYLIIWLAAMSYADIKRRKINIISIVVMGAGIIMLHLADVIDGSELELHLLEIIIFRQLL